IPAAETPAAETVTPFSAGSVPIGQPAAGADIYLLDGQLNRVPLGSVGEICIGGPGLARGYLNRPELTAQRFVMRAGERLYRTGDLGRWNQRGRLVYLGRCDRQVKIHGIRIELGEIEAVLMSYQQVSDCVVTPVTKLGLEETQLAAYYVSPVPLETAALRAFVAQRLPGSVRPVYFVWLEQIPLTNNGKVAVSQLPPLYSIPPEARTAVKQVAPSTSIERTIADIWQQVLRVESISVHDNFFDMGGDSIMAIQIAARLADAGVVISPNQIFQFATVAELAVVAVCKGAESTSEEASAEASADTPLVTLGSGQLDKLSALLDKADAQTDSDRGGKS
ncbi:MAG: non-ribosomal peptide synthetase, partial [Cyanobacteria bacterium J06559_1]